MNSLRAMVLTFVLAVFPADLRPQSATGTINGVIKDSTGAVIPGVTVTVTEQQTGIAVSVKSLHDGALIVPNLAPADYRLTIEADGFKRLVIDGLKVNVGTVLTQDATLEIGVTTEAIQVTGKTSLVETTSGGVGTTVQVSHVLEMPLVDRNVFKLVDLVPGAFTSAGGVSIGGGRIQSGLYQVDGVNNTRGGLGTTSIEMTPPVESMQEFKVEVNSFGAELGHSAAGAVNAVTKSGTNRYHGTFYEFVRNDKFDARGWGADALPPLRRNNFGGVIGGPIIRNRTFFFYNLDYLVQHDGVTKTRNVGLPEWRKGDFSTATRDAGGRAAVVPIYDPDTGNGTFLAPRNTTPFPDNIIPTSRLDPVAVKAVAYLPAPNRPPNNPFSKTGNWQENTVNTATRGYSTARIDHEWTSSTKIFGRYILTMPEDNLTGYSKGFGVADPDGLLIHNRRQNLALNMTHLFTPPRFVNLTAGVNRVGKARQKSKGKRQKSKVKSFFRSHGVRL